MNPRAVAQRFMDAISGLRPEWTFDPHQITYVHGLGLAESDGRRLVRATIEHGGVSSLCVRDKPALESRLVEFAAVNPNAARAGSPADVSHRREHP
jgi:hypothetical protein